MSLEIGTIVTGKVVSILPFGAFVEIEKGKTGLVHISEIAADYVKDIGDYLKVGDSVRVKLISIDPKGKISLSIKKALAEEKPASPEPAKPRPVRPSNFDWSAPSKSGADLSFEDKLNRFKSDSDERMQDLKRSMDSKRSGGYKR
jgi:S1 RNA binding domain protein